MKVIFVLVLTASAGYAVSNTDQTWTQFKATYNKSYTNTSEEAERLQIFINNVKQIEAHNEKYSKGEVTYRKSMNFFGDMTKNEFLNYINYNLSGTIAKVSSRSRNKRFVFSHTNLPLKVDWRLRGAVTSVKDQGYCGSCWSFSAVGSLEGQLAIKGRGLISLSVQNLIDCSWDYHNEGCNGGTTIGAFAYIQDNGIQKEEEYPYEAKDGGCRFDPLKSVTKVFKFHILPPRNESALREAVARIGPITAVIAVSDELQFYSGGYFYDDGCSNRYEDLDHSILVVGYGSGKHGDYWILKNSWGAGWGDSGYFLLARNRHNHCGIATATAYPELEEKPRNEDGNEI